MKPISYNAMKSSRQLGEFDQNVLLHTKNNPNSSSVGLNKGRDVPHHSQKSFADEQDMTEKTKMETTSITWDDALRVSGGKYFRLESGVRKTIVAKNARFATVEKTFKGETKDMVELTLDIVEVDGEEREGMTWNTVSKRLMGGLRPLFENVGADVEVRFSVKKIGESTDTNYDVEAL